MRLHILLLALGTLTALGACSKSEFEAEDIRRPSSSRPASVSIDASCSVIQSDESGAGVTGMATKAIIGQTTLVSLDANFIKLDEVRDNSRREDYKVTPLSSWNDPQTRILDATIMSSPDNTQDIFLRSIVFNPRQTYQIHTYDEDGLSSTDDTVTVGYVSRMLGWYPKTYTLSLDEDGTPADTPLTGIGNDYFRVINDADGNPQDCIIFENKLDGQTDVMVSDMREGRYDLRDFGNGFKNNDSAYDYDVQPYGHQFIDDLDPWAGFRYCNYFTFKHYLAGVRLFIHTEGSDMSLIGYKRINDVVFKDQPQSVAIALPRAQKRGDWLSGKIFPDNDSYLVHATLPMEGVEPIFGEAVQWWDEANMPIIRSKMVEIDPDYPEFSDEPVYPVIMENTVSLNKVYLGYMLVQPDRDTEIEIHTDAGIFSAVINTRAKFKITDEEGNVTEGEEDILKAGYIYNIIIDVKTNGSLEVIVGNEDEDKFRNLTPYNTAINDFEYSNCFVISPEKMKKDDGSYYDGFYFQAITPGRGQRGMINTVATGVYPTEQYFEPYTARILWQDHARLIKHVELVHGNIRFTLNDDCKENGMTGNAVLAAYDQDGNILWTWHIWVTDDLKDVTFNTGSDTFTMMNMNLGATRATPSDLSSVLDTYGLYYQWGRKDPSPGPPAYNYSQKDLSTSIFYYMDHESRDLVYEHFEALPTVQTSVLHPLDIIAPSGLGEEYSSDWLYSYIDQLWGYSPANGAVARKTIYDPCPYGYRVPDDELNALFTYCENNVGTYAPETTVGGVKVGATLSAGDGSSFFPYAGWRGHDYYRIDKTHAWFMVGEVGDYQDARVCKADFSEIGKVSSGSYLNHRGRSMLFSSSLLQYYYSIGRNAFKISDTEEQYYISRVDYNYSKRTNLAPVRCVRYDGAQEEPAQPVQ